MNARIQTIIKKWRMDGLIREQDRIVVGVSGGADSVCLLLLLCELRKQMDISLCTVHVHHGLRGDAADRDAAFTKALCERYDVAYREVHYDVAKTAQDRHLSIEEAGRILRYQCFEEIRQSLGYTKIAVAHHENDQAETVLLNLVRGTGMSGLCGMKQQEHSIIRPLLYVSRGEIEAVLAAYGQPYCQDATNADITYARNRIRNCVIGELEQVNSRATAHIAAAAQKVSMAQDCLWELCRESYMACSRIRRQHGVITEVDLDLDMLQKQQMYIRQEVVRMAVADMLQSMRDIGDVHIRVVCGLIALQPGRYVELPGDLRVYRNSGCLHFVCGQADTHLPEQNDRIDMKLIYDQQTVQLRTAQGQTMTAVLTEERPDPSDKKKYTKLLDCGKMKGNLVLRYPQDEDFLCIDAYGHKKTLNQYLKDEKIPAYARAGQLVLADGHHIVWVIGHRISSYYHVNQDTECVLKVTFLNQNDIQEGEDYDRR